MPELYSLRQKQNMPLELKIRMTDWQPIETAPKDGTRILAYGKHGLDVDEQKWATVVWQDYSKGFVCDPNEATEYDPEVSNITHWMPLPEKPK